MNKKYNLKLDLQFRCNNSTMKFNQFDDDTSDFFMRITNAGNLFDVEKAMVVLAVIKPSGKVASQFVEVENGLIYADLKANMKDEIGTYTARAMLILEDERVVTDVISYEVEEDKIFSLLNDTVETTEEFTLLTDMLNRLSTIEISEEQRMINEAERILSEENRKIEEAKRVEAELIRQHEEADRAKYDAIRESNENIRKQNESIRLANETNRIDEEAKRVEEENKRKLAEEERNANYNFMTEDEERRRLEANAHKEAEVLRVQAETNRVNEEAKRRTTEQTRVLAESTRVSNENTRKSNEIFRENNETQRIEAETQRKNRYNSFIADAEANASNFENYTNTAKVKEEERKTNELDRKSQEDRRVSNEVERISNENTRKANEVVREKNEASRQNTFTNKVNEVDKKISEINITKDNFISSINTKVDNKISELDTAKSDMTNTVTNKIDEVENRFNALTSKQQQDAEVIDARDGETSLKARLDRDIEKAKQVYVNVEGSHISTDSSSGYAKDVEILGNTIQDANNLADIRSVGDKVEGQELYEIPVLSRGKNLFDKNNIEVGYLKNTGIILHSSTWKTSDFIRVKNGATYYFSNLSGSSASYLVEYDKNKQVINSYTNYNVISAKKIILQSNTRYIRVATENLDTLQIEEGTVATPYEPYQEDKITILSPVQLEKVGDVRDRIIEKDGVLGVEKNVVDELIDLSSVSSINVDMDNTAYIICKSNNTFPTIAYYNNHFINNLLPSIGYNDAFSNDSEGVGVSGQWVRVRVLKSKLKSLDLQGAKEFIEKLILKYPTTNPQFIPLPHSQQVKLRTFANKTNISFGCEIEGTIKAQVPKSLGATVNTHTEQISNLNKELDRVKKLEESTVSTVETESDFTTVEATSNGYFEDVKLEGKTLVNLFDKSNFITEDFVLNGCSFTRSATGKKYGKILMPLDKLSLLKSNCKYKVIVNITKNTLIEDGGTQKAFHLFSYNYANTAIESSTDGTYSVVFACGETGVKDCIITLKDFDNPSYPIQNKALYFESSYYATSGELEGQILILECKDDLPQDVNFFEGLKSVGQSATTSEDGVDEVSVASIGVCMFDDISNPHHTKTIYPLGSGGIYWSEFKQYLTHFNNVSNYENCNNLYDYYYTSNNSIWVNLGSFDKAKALINLNYKISEINNKANKKRLLYYNNETQTWEKPILREWDSIEKHSDGKYYYHQRSGEVVLNGSESIALGTDMSDTIGFIYTASGAKQDGNIITTYFQKGNYYYDVECVHLATNNSIFFRVSKSKLPTQDVAGFKQWLQANNVTVVYQLAEEKVYECTNIDLITYANETNYIVECGAIVPKTTLKVHNNISNVVSLLQKKVSVLESNMTSYMITQNRLMLASRYNADTVSFKVDVATLRNSFEYDNDLYELILNNILVGKDNYDREYIENLIIFYWMDFVISDEMHSTLFEIIEEQHNPKIVEDQEEAPLI